MKHKDELPLVTVLMPAYNAQKYIKLAIDSIINQSYTHFEFLIINDGSSDDTVAIIKSYGDKRIRLINNETNMGVGYSLHIGIEKSRGKYIARMDADDISHPKRLEKQVRYLEKHPEISLVGTWARTIDGENENIKIFSLPLRHKAVMAKMVYHCSLIHPSVMYRVADFKKHSLNYNKSIRYPLEDKDLWLRSGKVLKFKNLPLLLVKYRQHNDRPVDLQKSKKIYEFYDNALKDYFSGRLNNDEVKIITKFVGTPTFITNEKPTSEDYNHFIQLIKSKKINKAENAYFGYVLLQIVLREKNVIKYFSLYDRIYLFILNIKWLVYQV